MEYVVQRRGSGAAPQVASVAHFHPRSSEHRPRVTFSMEYDDAGVSIAFDVADRYVVCRRTKRQEMVCRDSCVEAFLQPKPNSGYFNFETNCGGTMLAFYVTDATRVPGTGLAAFEPVADELLDRVRIEHTMPPRVEPEIASPVEWNVRVFVPNELFERYVGPLEPPARRRWRGNFFKCADESSHPHWASWNPIGEELNFHSPEHFAAIRFASP
jgi:hypothetical protein